MYIKSRPIWEFTNYSKKFKEIQVSRYIPGVKAQWPTKLFLQGKAPHNCIPSERVKKPKLSLGSCRAMTVLGLPRSWLVKVGAWNIAPLNATTAASSWQMAYILTLEQAKVSYGLSACYVDLVNNYCGDFLHLFRRDGSVGVKTH